VRLHAGRCWLSQHDLFGKECVHLSCADALLAPGDWFNRIDWTGQHNNFGIGLPPASKNQQAWEFKRPLLAAADRYGPTPAIISRQAAYFKALLRVRCGVCAFASGILCSSMSACLLAACLHHAAQYCQSTL
jgi:hypothetical protein